MREPDMPFSDTAREILGLAGQEARRLGHEYVGTEHFVLAFTGVTDGALGTTLSSLRLDRESVRALIESTVRPGPGTSPRDAVLPYTSRTYRVFALAKESAHDLGAEDIGAEHLLLGVLREAKGAGGQVLAHYGLSETAALEEIKRSTRSES